MTDNSVVLEKRGLAFWITINRPEKRNAVRPRTYEELADAFRRADREEATRFVVLTGAGDGFCAGDDFQEIFLAEGRSEDHEDRRLRRYRDRRRATNPVIADILGCEKPVIAAVGGA
ncbi:MAG TPA: enoyl-CoA hydratase/isomerase family protein, partial [Bradyrhizobium sp.]|nr:enoyl-CoA hydratase/isomerase family protein [Bradyrhizobium sp.]